MFLVLLRNLINVQGRSIVEIAVAWSIRGYETFRVRRENIQVVAIPPICSQDLAIYYD